ncbi:hypothetical protein Tco_1196578, partial [Tanacetum coccineum]
MPPLTVNATVDRWSDSGPVTMPEQYEVSRRLRGMLSLVDPASVR